MKKLLLSACIVSASLSVTNTVFAAGGHGPAGCGLGTEVIFRNADEWHEHVMAATTNVSGSQTFAMTSGTLGCEDANGPLKHGVAVFMENNLDQLAVESAQGHGETLAALSELIGIQTGDTEKFNHLVKVNFDRIFHSAEVTSGEAFNSLVAVMQEDDTLSHYLFKA
jgi:hypothetical protein